MSKKNKQVKSEIKVKISNLINCGRKEITTKTQLEKYPIGSLISYMNKQNIFKTGGYIIKYTEEYYIYVGIDFTTKYRVRYKNINKMWVGNVYEVKNDIVSLTESKNEKTKFKVTINDVDIYYAKNSYNVKRFLNTEKYERMLAWYNYFSH